MPQDNKQSFEQTFKIEKPKLNDLWAGILVCAIESTGPTHTHHRLPSSSSSSLDLSRFPA